MDEGGADRDDQVKVGNEAGGFIVVGVVAGFGPVMDGYGRMGGVEGSEFGLGGGVLEGDEVGVDGGEDGKPLLESG